MKKQLKKFLLGITLQQEYLCININEFNKPLKLFTKNNESEKLTDITDQHLFIGYKPLLIAIDKNYLNEGGLNSYKQLIISFQTENKFELAKLELNLVKEIKLDSCTCLIYEGVKGTSSYLNLLNKLINKIYYNLTSDKKQNIYLRGNLYDQIKIAYSIPRNIYLASVGSENLFNIFPTDLSGKFENEYFIVSLRSGGKANEQVSKYGKCMISVMKAESFRDVYNAGKNHMKELSDIEKIGVKVRNEKSAQLKLPVPKDAVEYYELSEIEHFDIGIHVIHFFRITNSHKLAHGESVLGHIHREYAEWRIKNDIQTNYLIRN